MAFFSLQTMMASEKVSLNECDGDASSEGESEMREMETETETQ